MKVYEITYSPRSRHWSQPQNGNQHAGWLIEFENGSAAISWTGSTHLEMYVNLEAAKAHANRAWADDENVIKEVASFAPALIEIAGYKHERNEHGQ